MLNRFVLLVLVPLLCSLVMAASEYHNQFAVQVSGGKREAEEVARRLGLEFKGGIGNLEDHYLLEASHLEKRQVKFSLKSL